MKAVVALALMFSFLLSCGFAEENTLASGIEAVITDLDFSGLDEISIIWPGSEERMNAQQTMRAVIDGQNPSVDEFLLQLINGFTESLSEFGALALAIVFPVLLTSLVTQLLPSGNTYASVCKLVCLLMILMPIVTCVIGELEHVRHTITAMTERMEHMLPLLLTLLTAIGGSASSAFFHPMVVAASGTMVYIAREVILRLVMCTCAVTTVNHLSEKAHLTRLARLLRSAVCWLLGVSFTAFLGAMSLQGVCSASVDGVAIRAAKYAVDNFVPVVGGMFSDTMDTLVGCSLIVKNALGVTAMIVLIGVIATPMMRTLAAVAIMKLCAALLEPIASESIVDAISDFSGTMVLFLITMLCVGTMYFLLIVQILLMGNLTVLLR